MLIIARSLYFLTLAVELAIIAVIGLMILRLIGDAADLNPFGWASRALRRSTDVFIIPVRATMREVGMDGKFAPLVVILISILLGFFMVQLLTTLANTIDGVIASLRAGALIAVVGFILYGLLSFYILLIFVRIIFSWGMVSYRNRVMRFLVDATEPLLGPLRRIIPPLGRMDISPLVAFLILWLLQAAVSGTLLRGAAPLAF